MAASRWASAFGPVLRCWLQKLGRDRAVCEDCEAWIGVLLTELGGLKIPADRRSATAACKVLRMRRSSAAVTTWFPSRSIPLARVISR